jgi:hypothetical protein
MTEWDGVERRANPSNIDALRGELRRLRAELEAIRTVIFPREEAELRRREFMWRIGVTFAATVLVLVVLGHLMLSNQHEIKQKVEAQARCVMEQLLEHRNANETAHQDLAKATGTVYRAPALEYPPPVPGALKNACDQFIPKSQGGTK